VKLLWKYVKRYWIWAVLGVIGMFLQIFFKLINPYLIRILIDQYILKNDFVGATRMMYLILGFTLGVGIPLIFSSWAINVLTFKVMKDIRMDMFRHMMRQGLYFFSKTPTGVIVTRITNDVASVGDVLAGSIPAIVSDVFIITGVWVFLFLVNTKLALIELVFAPIIAILAIGFGRWLRDLYSHIRDVRATLNIKSQEILSAIPIIQVFVQVPRIRKDYEKTSLEYRNSLFKAFFITDIFNALSGPVLKTSMQATAIVAGGYLILRGSSTIGDVVAFLTYINYLIEPIRDIADKYTMIQDATSAIMKIQRFMNENWYIPDAENPHTGRPEGYIRYDNVHFAYPGTKKEVIRGVSFEALKGKKIALVGFTGSGKSTLLNLALRFYDVNKGAIYVDDIDIRQWKKDDLRSGAAVVLQEPFLFKGTIRDNITLGRDIPLEKVIDAAKRVHAHDFIKDLPNGYDTMVLSGGANLSVGQRQLISLARALVHHPSILILDEATASIDSETERLIQEGLEEVMKGRTTLMVAHRLSTIREADKILVLDSGRVVEEGTHEELLKKRGLYYELYMLQWASGQ